MSLTHPTPAAVLTQLRSRLTVAVISALVTLAALWLSLLPARTLSVDVGTFGSGDLIYLSGVYHRESADDANPDARAYRWARGDATITLPVGQAGATIFSVEMYAVPQPGGGPLPFAMHAGPTTSAFAVGEAVRVYRVLIPASAIEAGVVRLRFACRSFTPPGDDRQLAVALDRFSLRPLGATGLPALPIFGIEAVVSGMVALLVWANRMPWRVVAASALAGAALLVFLNLSARYWLGLAAWPLAAVATALAGASLLARRLLPQTTTTEARFIRALWRIALAGLAIRLIGVSAPGFAFNDLDIQSILLRRVVSGDTYLSVISHEFGGGQTFYPSGPYLLVLPLLLLRPALPFALHLGAALFDGCAPVGLALIARELGLRWRTALVAAALLAVLPIQLTALWWGFFTNIGGQALLLLLLWLLLRHTRRPTSASAGLLFIALSLVLVSHVGVLILTGTAAALALGLAWLPARPSGAAWRGLLLAGVGAVAVFALAYLSFVATPMLGSAQGVLTSGSGRLTPARLAQGRAYLVDMLPVALWRGLGTLSFLLLAPGLALIWARAGRPLGRAVTVGWLLAPLLYVVVEYLYLVQVRYIYFLAPLCCLATGAVLDHLWTRRSGRAVAVFILALIAWLGLALWFNGAIVGLKMSLVPLTH